MKPSHSLILAVILLAGCRPDMNDQPRYKPLAPSDFFGDGRSARPQVPDTVARGQLHTNELFYTGKIGGKVADVFPLPVTDTLLLRGRERYDIFCAPCHDRVGTGRGMVVQRGFKQPNSFHIDRLRQSPVGYFFDVTTTGFGMMPSYATQVSPEDRWAIVAYIRALQLSQHAATSDVPASVMGKLQ
jgi:Cytochrome C oxidase, cbb3-type, subunit III